jgi:hypothetical protein
MLKEDIMDWKREKEKLSEKQSRQSNQQKRLVKFPSKKL